MRVTLVIPPSPFLLDDRAFPFLGPLQVAALLRERGHDVRVADLTGYKQRHPGVVHADPDTVLDEAEQRLWAAAGDADLVGFYSLAAQHPYVMRLNRFIRGANARCVTVVGGPHANTAPERCAADGFDYVIVSDQGGGGGEPGVLELVERRLQRTVMVREVGGKTVLPLLGGGASDRIIRVPSRVGSEWENDLWPLPARDLVDLRSYHYCVGGERATSIVSATGCPFACTYCSHWAGYRKLEAKSSRRVREEIRGIREEYDWRAIMFYDDEINLRPDFTTEFLPMLRAEGVLWRAFFKNGKRLTTDAVFEAMAASGCVQLCTGAEAADAQILKDIKKGASLEDNTAFVRLCVKHGIKPKVFTQVGLPGESPETVQALRDWLVQMASEGLDDADVSITTPYEGTPIYDEPEKHKIHFNKEEIDFSKDVVLYKGVPGEYRSFVWHDRLSATDLVAARDWVEREFRSAAGLKPLLAKDDG